MADVQPLFVNSDGLPQEMDDTDSLDLGGLTMTGDIAMGTNEVTGLPASPSSDDAAASKAYVDAVASGMTPKDAARAATTAALSTFTAAGSGVGKTLTAPSNASSFNTIDGVLLTIGDRVLVKDGGPNATPAIDNGIYEVTALGDDASTSFELTRTTDFDTTAEALAGSHLWVTEGSTQADTAWVVTTNNPITVDTTAIAWSQYGGPGAFTGGDGIDISAGTISVDLASNPGLEFNGGQLRVLAYNGITRDANGISVDAHNGITVDANGVSVNAGSGLVANAGPGDLDIDLATGAVIEPGLQFGTGADADKLAVLPDPAGAIDVLTAGLHVRTDDTTIQINGSNELEVIGAGDANRVAEEVTADENVSAGDPVYWRDTDEVGQSQADGAGRRKVIGIMEDAVTTGNDGTLVRRGVATGVISGATAGDRYFLDQGGGLTTSPPTGSGDAVWFIGHAKNATDLDVQPQFISIRA